MNEDGKKSFYALNLTEGRMFGIFIGIVIVLVAIFFTIFVTASKLSKPKAVNNMRVEQIETKQTNTQNNESDFSFYTDLVGENSVKQDSVVTKEVVKLESTNQETQNQTNVQTAQAETQELEPQLSVDNSEVLYSSRYQQNFKKETTQAQPTPAKNTVAAKKPETQTKEEPTQTTKNEPAKTVETKAKTETKTASNAKTSERYVVQIGSYTNKNVADEIASHYTKGGYPVYQQEFTKDGKTFYRLRVGPFKEKDRAENYLISIKSSKYGKNSYISKIYI